MMKNNKLITILFPALCMSFITVFTFLSADTNLGMMLKMIFALSLMVLFPLMFLIQGIRCALARVNVVLSLGISSLTFLLLIAIYLNSTAYPYLFVYLSCGLMGYVISFSVLKFKDNKKALEV